MDLVSQKYCTFWLKRTPRLLWFDVLDPCPAAYNEVSFKSVIHSTLSVAKASQSLYTSAFILPPSGPAPVVVGSLAFPRRLHALFLPSL